MATASDMVGDANDQPNNDMNKLSERSQSSSLAWKGVRLQSTLQSDPNASLHNRLRDNLM